MRGRYVPAVVTGKQLERRGFRPSGRLALLPLRALMAHMALSIMVAIGLLTSIAVAPAQAAEPMPSGVSGTWELKFNEEFSASGLNKSIWTAGWQHGGTSGPMSGKCMSSSNVSQPGDGYLHLELKAQANSCSWEGENASVSNTGSLVESNPGDGVPGHVGFAYSYGYVEWRVWIPGDEVSGCPRGGCLPDWPGLWSEPVDEANHHQTEIDTMEGLGSKGQACFHFHYFGSIDEEFGNCEPGLYAGGWHTFGADWEPGVITYYYDGVQVGQVTSANVGSKSQYLVMDFEPPLDGQPLAVPDEYNVDYVRVWQHPINKNGAGTSVMLPTGELLVFARNTAGELISFNRTTSGTWSAFNETAIVNGNPDITGSPSPIMLPTGELLVFARNTAGELISFNRTTSGTWSAFNETAIVNGNPDITGSPSPIMLPTGELLVFARNTAGELISFNRTTSGTWSAFNETAIVNGNPDITGSPSPIMLPTGELLVFARNTAGELISFNRTTSGTWSAFNETAIVNGNPDITGSPSPIMLPTGELLVFARNTAGELISFNRTTSGTWSAFNETAIVNGNPDITGSPSPIMLPTGELLVFARNTAGELISFNRTTSGTWSAFNETAIVSGNPDITGMFGPIMLPTNELLVFARNTAGELISFNRTTSGTWSAFNETAIVSGNPHVANPEE